MLYEMLVGIVRSISSDTAEARLIFYFQTPFWADNHSDMYYRVLQDELVFPEEIHIDRDTRSLIRGVSIRTLHPEIFY